MVEERLFTIDLTKAFNHTRTKRVRRAVALLRDSVAHFTKTPVAQIRLSEKLNTNLWQHSIDAPPRRIKIKVEKKGELVHALLPDEKMVEKKAEEKKPAEKKTEEKKETVKSAEPKTGGKISEVKTEAGMGAGKKVEATPAEKYAEKPRELPKVHAKEAKRM